MFGDGLLTFQEFAMGETLPLATIHAAALEFLRDRDDVVVYRARAVNAYVREPSKKAMVSKLLVDCGAELIPEAALKRAGVQVLKKEVPFAMANGQTITRAPGYAILRAEGLETVDEVVFGQPGDLARLGARTLEGFGAMVDARQKKLVAAGPYPAAGVSV